MLKPCPFCGDMPHKEPFYDGHDKIEGYTIGCYNVYCMVQPQLNLLVDDNPDEWWNKRASTRLADGVVEFLEALKVAQETGAEIKMTPLMWKAVEKIRAAIGGNYEIPR